MRKPTGEFYAQIRAERANPRADVWYGGTIDPFLQAAAEGLFVAYRSPGVADLQPWARRVTERSGLMVATIYRIIIGFGTSATILTQKELVAPRCWSDLLSPAYGKEIELANPVTSGTGYTILATLVTLYGEDGAFDYLRKLLAERGAIHPVGHRAGTVGRPRRGGRRRFVRPRIHHAEAGRLRGDDRDTLRRHRRRARRHGDPEWRAASGRGAGLLRLGADQARAGTGQPHQEPARPRACAGRDSRRGRGVRQREDAGRGPGEIRGPEVRRRLLARWQKEIGDSLH